MLLLLLLIIVGAIIEANRTPEEKAERAAKKQADEESDRARREADAAKLRAAQERRNQAFEPFMEHVNEINKKAESRIIQRISQVGDRVDITVDNTWHFMPYQVRLQAAQNLWKSWATLSSPDDPDKARIKLVDLNGNEVGGSRVLGGSLIWVQEK